MSRFMAQTSVTAGAKCSHERLRQTTFFADCEQDFLTRLMMDLQVELFNDGDIIIQQGDSGEKLYCLMMGEVDVCIGPDKMKVASLKEGTVFGEMAMFSHLGEGFSKRSATIRAAGFCDCRTIDRFHLYTILKQYPKEKQKFVKIAMERKSALEQSKAASSQDNEKPKKAVPGPLGQDAASRERSSRQWQALKQRALLARRMSMPLPSSSQSEAKHASAAVHQEQSRFGSAPNLVRSVFAAQRRASTDGFIETSRIEEVDVEGLSLQEPADIKRPSSPGLEDDEAESSDDSSDEEDTNSDDGKRNEDLRQPEAKAVHVSGVGSSEENPILQALRAIDTAHPRLRLMATEDDGGGLQSLPCTQKNCEPERREVRSRTTPLSGLPTSKRDMEADRGGLQSPPCIQKNCEPERREVRSRTTPLSGLSPSKRDMETDRGGLQSPPCIQKNCELDRQDLRSRTLLSGDVELPSSSLQLLASDEDLSQIPPPRTSKSAGSSRHGTRRLPSLKIATPRVNLTELSELHSRMPSFPSVIPRGCCDDFSPSTLASGASFGPESSSSFGSFSAGAPSQALAAFMGGASLARDFSLDSGSPVTSRSLSPKVSHPQTNLPPKSSSFKIPVPPAAKKESQRASPLTSRRYSTG
eukprot:TRINITY_DN10988_c0_g1_i4.p1 TRINITY_DN10988_c0_g1~~TRINITY_DN10988_c0_g1_i4.p1  ORF type:complete len:640 (-),score=115.99 TRINITY_DN10988_c0_g1_i4:38-1957(-)